MCWEKCTGKSARERSLKGRQKASIRGSGISREGSGSLSSLSGRDLLTLGSLWWQTKLCDAAWLTVPTRQAGQAASQPHQLSAPGCGTRPPLGRCAGRSGRAQLTDHDATESMQLSSSHIGARVEGRPAEGGCSTREQDRQGVWQRTRGGRL